MVIDAINHMEQFGQGLNFKTLNSWMSKGHSFTVGKYILIFYGQALVYLLLAFAMDYLWIRTYIIYQNINLRVTRQRTRGKTLFHDRRMTHLVQLEYSMEPSTVHLDEVTKVKNKQVVIRNISMELYQGSINVLMGHNGSGKTMLLKLIAGFTSATSGKIIINGFPKINQMSQH